MKPKPRALRINALGVPDALKAQRRWAVWSYRCDGKRWAKVPIDGAKPNDPSTWLSFDEAYRRYQRGHGDGLLFALGDGWAALDLDHALDRDDIIDANALDLVDQFDTFTEWSPSSDGLHILFRVDPNRCPWLGLERKYAPTAPDTPWSTSRFVAVTGDVFRDRPIHADRTDLLLILAGDPPPREITPRGQGYADAATMDDDQLLLQMAGASNGPAFLALWRGKYESRYASHSEADLALVAILGFWTDYEADRAYRLFAQSKLFRPDKKQSYINATFRKAGMKAPTKSDASRATAIDDASANKPAWLRDMEAWR